jgi:drug/metabolite transporter (DMT)-like permease
MLGELAAVLTAGCWTFTSIFFSAAGRRVGAPVVNLMRLLLAVVIMLGVHRVARGTWWPVDASLARWGWLGVSGVIGLTLGDAALFESMVYIGPRLAMLLMALAPIFATLLAWLFLRETLAPIDLLAVALTVAGVAWVVLEREAVPAEPVERGRFAWGVLFGGLGALGQAVGLLLSREGLAGDYSVVSANFIRLTAACAAAWAAGIALGQGRRSFGLLARHPRAGLAIAGGTVAGPVVGVMLSLVAIQLAPLGIASTLMALAPILILPVVRVLYRERISQRALAGTVLALVGVAIIFLL